MIQDLAPALGWGIAAIALFTFLSIGAWSSARQKEREAYYRSDAIKKIAEMPGATPEFVLQMLREGVGTKEQPRLGAMSMMMASQIKAYYRGEVMKKIAEMQGAGADALLAVLREEERNTTRRVREGLKLAGLITVAAGVGLSLVLRPIVPEVPVYLVGFIPILVGVVLLGYGYFLAPKTD
jgi:hypothetical protein